MLKIPYRPVEYIHGQLAQKLKRTFEEVVAEGNFILGKRLRSFEQAFADYQKVKFAVGVGSGHDALLLSLLALGIGPGDEVIVPAHTFFATLLAVHNTGAKPVLVDSDPATFNIDVTKIEAAITRSTRAIIPVHLYGLPAEMDTVLSLAAIHKCAVVEDFAQSHGARYKNRITGSMGEINATSFYPVKNLGALGDGGMITTQSSTLAEKARMLRNYGSGEKHIYNEAGYNSRLDEIQAAILEVKLSYLDAWNTERRNIAAQYKAALKELAAVQLPEVPELCAPVYHIFAIQTEKRDQLRTYLRSRGIETLVHYPVPVHHQPAGKQMEIGGKYPVAEKLAATELSLPVFPGLQQTQIEYIADAICTFYRSNRV